MNVNERQEEFKKFSQEQSSILLNKGHDYTAGQAEVDAYANFRIIAKLLEGAPFTSYTVTMVYYLKHVLSCITFAKSGRQESGEPLRGRHLDLGNYAFIMDMLVPDHEAFFEVPVLRKEIDALKRECRDVAGKSPEQLIDELRQVGKWPPAPEPQRYGEPETYSVGCNCEGCQVERKRRKEDPRYPGQGT